ncbi:MAG: hypothetical protein ABWY06_20230 [Pseudomonas sp.]|uniref:DUF6929 family protein n=1 Tax=Pseudomonas sp. TaxID=306 RepID=UPI0033930E36
MQRLRLSRIADLGVSAASALVCQRERLWLVADDALDLQQYDLAGQLLARWPLLPGTLPREAKARKRRKPDFEALAVLPDGALLALGSGSKPNRRGGCLFRDGGVRLIDLAPLFLHLETLLLELNVEGAVVRGDRLLLAQRGNGQGGENALVELDLAQALRDLDTGQLSAAALLRLVPLDLGELDGVPLSLTDLALAPDGRLYFSAAAEATDSSYLDGACMGSVLGRLNTDLSLADLVRLEPLAKVEGLAFAPDGAVLLVADADDPTVPAPLFSLSLAGWGVA